MSARSAQSPSRVPSMTLPPAVMRRPAAIAGSGTSAGRVPKSSAMRRGERVALAARPVGRMRDAQASCSAARCAPARRPRRSMRGAPSAASASARAARRASRCQPAARNAAERCCPARRSRVCSVALRSGDPQVARARAPRRTLRASVRAHRRAPRASSAAQRARASSEDRRAFLRTVGLDQGEQRLRLPCRASCQGSSPSCAAQPRRDVGQRRPCRPRPARAASAARAPPVRAKAPPRRCAAASAALTSTSFASRARRGERGGFLALGGHARPARRPAGSRPR